MTLSSLFKRPLLIYDDKCYWCYRFARTARALSRGRIRIAGHHYSNEAAEAKSQIFPAGYDPTKMFWLINESGAHGARSGLLSAAKEIIVGVFSNGEAPAVRDSIRGGTESCDSTNAASTCEYKADDLSMGGSCYQPVNVARRLVNVLRNSAFFKFD